MAVVACNGPKLYCGKGKRVCHPDKKLAGRVLMPDGGERTEDVFVTETAWCFTLGFDDLLACYPTEKECDAVSGGPCFEMKPEQHPEAGK